MTVAVGFFDGVHIGHRAILSGADLALTFKNHPLTLLAPDRAPRLLMPFESRIAAIRACGVAKVEAIDFDAALASTAPEEFAKRLPAKSVRCGENWRFGKGGKGDADYLRKLGFDVTVVPYETIGGETVSSTRIRAAVSEGRMEEASVMLGRPFALEGEIKAGKGLGRGMGFPTINIKVDLGEGAFRLAEPPFGAYAVELGGKRGVANWGVAPTMGERAWREAVLEVHLLEGAGDFAEGRVKIGMKRFLRPERRFASLDELKSQIALDVKEARNTP